MEPAKKFYIFHQWHVGKSANIEEGSSPTEYPVIAASHPKQNPCIMSKVVGESVNYALWEANSEVTANEIRIIHDAPNLIQTPSRNFGIDMNKPKDITVGDTRAGVHLPGTTAIALDNLITKSGSEPICAIGASTVCNNVLSFRRSLAQVLKKRSYQRRFVEYRNNDRNLHSSRFTKLSSGGEPSVRLAHSKILDLSGIKPFGHASCKQAE
jgi:hypothetical protein